MVVWRKVAEPPEPMEILYQSPLAGVVAVPSLLASPPTVSSLMEVNVTGLPAAPWASRTPATFKELVVPSNLTTLSAGKVRVVSALTVKEPLMIQGKVGLRGSIVSAPKLPASLMPFLPLPEPLLPDNEV